MPNFDLHSHSTHSDGLLTPPELVARAAQRGVATLALTDHDEMGGLAAAREAAREAGIAFVNGVEISVTWGDHTLHVVGLHVDPENRQLVAGLKQVRSGRSDRAGHIAASLEKAGIAGSLEGARAYATNAELVGRTHFARFLVERGHARDVQGVFKKYLTAGKPGYVPHQWASLEQAVGWIRASGGIPILAHPGRYKMDNARRASMLENF
ncbi:MAG: PHP domain-containing protein, partial [Burkholderiales bacterium]|nr:PHP domain-containing protein [Burkholderiales bacterium]